jgi:hypothetical protein
VIVALFVAIESHGFSQLWLIRLSKTCVRAVERKHCADAYVGVCLQVHYWWSNLLVLLLSVISKQAVALCHE